MALHRSGKATKGDVYAARRAGHLTLGGIGQNISGSKEIIRAQLTGTEPDRAKIGAPGDVLNGAQSIADFINLLSQP
jgi:hypothetical protein